MGDGAETVKQDKLNLNFPCDFAKHNTVSGERARFCLGLLFFFLSLKHS